MDPLPDPVAPGPSPASRPSGEVAVELSHARKRFGETVAVDSISFTIGTGDLFGFIGPNGAGKTTTIKMLATLLQPDGGTLRVMGHDVTREAHRVRRLIGYMPDFLGSYPELAVWEYLDFFGATYGISTSRRRAVIDELFQLTDLGDKARALVGSLSRGMQQRLSLARALIHDPKVLLLDEPASGLDPRARIELRAILQELQRMGKTILLSSHILTELSEICTHIGIIERGRMVFVGDLRDALARARTCRRARIKVRSDTVRARTILEACQGVESVTEEDGVLVLEIAGDQPDLGFVAEVLIPQGISLLSLEEEDLSLEEAFMRLTKGVVS